MSQLLLQDVERQADKVKIRQGASGERIPSAHDPEMRHGRKSPSKRFDGHKLGLAVDTDEQLITAVDVTAGSATDNEDAMRLVVASEASTGNELEVAMGDAGYGSGATRRSAKEAQPSSRPWRCPRAHVGGPDHQHLHWSCPLLAPARDQAAGTSPIAQITSKMLAPHPRDRDGYGGRSN